MFYFHVSGRSTPSHKDIYICINFKWSHVCIHAHVWPFPFLPSRKKSTLTKTWENVAKNKKMLWDLLLRWDKVSQTLCLCSKRWFITDMAFLLLRHSRETLVQTCTEVLTSTIFENLSPSGGFSERSYDWEKKKVNF